jgi:hypothetical protein
MNGIRESVQGLQVLSDEAMLKNCPFIEDSACHKTERKSGSECRDGNYNLCGQYQTIMEIHT